MVDGEDCPLIVHADRLRAIGIGERILVRFDPGRVIGLVGSAVLALAAVDLELGFHRGLGEVAEWYRAFRVAGLI